MNTSDIIGTKIISWNTGRTYTAKGQRIAAVELGNSGVFMVDQDRGISYYLPDCEFSRSSIMHRYDHNINCDYFPVIAQGVNKWELIDKLNTESANK